MDYTIISEKESDTTQCLSNYIIFPINITYSMAILFPDRLLRFSCFGVLISTFGGLILLFTYLESSVKVSHRYPSFRVFPIVESYGKLSVDFNLHEWFRKSLEDSAKEVLVNNTVQRVTGNESTSYDPSPSRTPAVLFNVLPKTGSRTLVMLVHKVRTLGTVNITMTNSMNLLKSPNEKIDEINQTLASRQNPHFVYSHLKFVEFVTERERPMYVSIIRDPIDRLNSHYYFKRYGDSFSENSTKMSQLYREKMKAKNLSDDSFDDCVLKGAKECASEWMMNAYVYHYSGYDNHCDNHDWGCMLKIAKDNVRNHYAVIGTLEDYPNFVRVLEKMIPEVFLGLHSFYKSDFSEMKTHQKRPPTEEVRTILRENMKNDYDFYDFVKKDFEAHKRKLGL